jgi:hypothetical protein
LLSDSSVRMLHWNSQGTRIRCPELEIGANSVSPWTIPSTIASMTLVEPLLMLGFEAPGRGAGEW